jgi:dipeptidyl aminopeptidase/acylaminoacyl peptidase
MVRCMLVRSLAFSLIAVAAVPCPAHGQRSGAASREVFSLSQVLSAPFASDLVAGPDGRSVAWVGDVGGMRNVYAAEAPAWQARQLTRYAADDGQEIGGLVWTPDGRGLLYVRGGDRSAAGEVPNPTSSPRGAQQEVWLAPLTGGAPRRLGEGSDPVPAPTGERVAFLLRDTAWAAPLGTSGPARILFRARGRTAGLAWAPDGARVAFTSQRGDHAFIGIYDLDRDTIRYLAPSVDRDALPRWSPDGRQVAFVRSPGGTAGPAPAGGAALAPWAIWLADAETGEGREVWRAPATPDGAFPGVSGDWGLLWSADDRLVFAGEMGGWLGLYSVSAQGGDAIRLTPPDCEVESAAFEADHRGLLYTSNCGDSERRHVARVSAMGSAPQALTGGSTIDWAPQPLEGGGFAYLGADARRTGAPIVVSQPGGRPQRVSDFDPWPGFPGAALVEPQLVTVRTSDSVDVRMQLFLPPGGAAGRRPAVIFFHGGPSRQMLLGWHYMYYYHNAYAFNQYLASRGFVVLSVNFRGGIGYGRAFRQAPRRGMRGASEYLDVLAAAAWLRARPDVDSTRIGLWGGSYGGYLTALGLARNSDLFAAGVDLHGVHDWSMDRGVPVGARAPQAADSVVALWRASSPVADVERWRSPVLLIQGDDDRNVSFSQTVDLAQRLRRQGVEVRQLVFPDEVHDFLRHAHWLAAYSAGAEFLIAKLMPGGN